MNIFSRLRYDVIYQLTNFELKNSTFTWRNRKEKNLLRVNEPIEIGGGVNRTKKITLGVYLDILYRWRE